MIVNGWKIELEVRMKFQAKLLVKMNELGVNSYREEIIREESVEDVWLKVKDGVVNIGAIIYCMYSNQMQLAQGHHLNADLALVLPAFGCCIPLLYLCPRWTWHCATCDGGVFLSPISEFENTPLAVMVIITCCNLRWRCFPWSTI